MKRESFNRIVAEEMARVRSMSYEVRRSGLLAWRWTVVLTEGGQQVDERLCLTRRAAERRGRRWLDDEQIVVAMALNAISSDVIS